MSPLDKPEIADMSISDKTEKKLRNLKPFQGGENWAGNVKGRPRGSRSLLGSQYYDDCYASWVEEGPAALQKMARTDWGGYCKMMGSILPREVMIKSLTAEVSIEVAAELRDIEDFGRHFAIIEQAAKVVGANPEFLRLDDADIEEPADG